MKTDAVEMYLHLPFCLQKCRYCDFLSGPADAETQRQYIEALCAEIREVELDLPVCSIYLGGGTPSVLPVEWLAEILQTLRACNEVQADAEISIEANPGTVQKDALLAYRDLGIRRISLGCQSFQDAELQTLGRLHTAEQAVEAISLARQTGFSNLNLDLMFGLPGQTKESWADTLAQAIALAPTHLSIYGLQLEEGTPLYDAVQTAATHTGKEAALSPLPDEETERAMYDQAIRTVVEAGYMQYEISNFAQEGYACRHNIGYWTGVPYVGFGVGAASYLPEQTENGPVMVRYTNEESLLAYTAEVFAHKDLQVLSQRDLEAEFFILGLRMTAGVAEQEFQERFGRSVDAAYGPILEKYNRSGHLIREQGRIRLSAEGVSVSNAILADFL